MSSIDRQLYRIDWHDFDDFIGCFGNTKIMPADIDFIVEKHGYFLIIEFKEENKNVFVGQEITLQKLSHIPKFTVLLAYHKPRDQCPACQSVHDQPQFTSMKIYPYGNLIRINNEELLNFVKNWYQKADNYFNKYQK